MEKPIHESPNKIHMIGLRLTKWFLCKNTANQKNYRIDCFCLCLLWSFDVRKKKLNKNKNHHEIFTFIGSFSILGDNRFVSYNKTQTTGISEQRKRREEEWKKANLQKLCRHDGIHNEWVIYGETKEDRLIISRVLDFEWKNHFTHHYLSILLLIHDDVLTFKIEIISSPDSFLYQKFRKITIGN